MTILCTASAGMTILCASSRGWSAYRQDFHEALCMQGLPEVSAEKHTLRTGALEARARLAATTGNATAEVEHLVAAVAAQQNLLACLRGEFEDIVDDACSHAAALGRRLAARHMAAGRSADARAALEEALAVAPADAATRLDIAQLALDSGDAESCQTQVCLLACLSPPARRCGHCLASIVMSLLLPVGTQTVLSSR